MPGQLSGKAAIAGIGATDFSKDSGRSELRLAAEAVLAALDDAGLTPADVALLHESRLQGASTPLPADPAPLAALIKSLPQSVTGTSGIERAISTAGGIALDEIDEGLMLKRRPGVFIAGEMLDWDAPTGGYLLQACFATGHAAGAAVVRRLHAV
jgi:predicted flavoprotein YhiN